MPSLITHHIFGEDAAQRLPEGLVDGEEELLAFLLGNEGPDPFFVRFRTIPARVAACRHLAHDMHASHVTRHLATSAPRWGTCQSRTSALAERLRWGFSAIMCWTVRRIR